jgi:DNA-binding transcriptional regulator/RsmH inhibitor MraZ
MFIGEYQASIDEKGRTAVPVKFRKLLKKKVVVTRGLDVQIKKGSKELLDGKKIAE